RPIATFQMKEPFQVQNQKIGLVELPAPKPGSPYQLGFEHAEFVIQESFDVFVSKFPALRFSKSGNKNVNPELCLKTKIGQVKFHHLSLDRVIEIEKSQFRDIIFDLDGTLIQSREAIYEINRIVFSEAQERGVSVEEVKEKFHTEFSKLFEAFGVDCPEKKKNALSKWGQVSGKFSYDLFDGVKSLFTTLSFASMTDSKPHEGSLCFDWNQANLNSVLMLGDSPSDMLGSKNIKAVAAAALWDPYSTEQSMVSSGAELFFHNVSELESWLLEKEVL
ncbi:MAG: VOC family protein, partial [Pseudobdellovibrionaceae bacterium]